MSKTPSNNDKYDFLAMAREALAIEAQAVLALSERLNDQFSQATTAILNCKGRVILVGVGKSGLIAKKLQPLLPVPVLPPFSYMPLRRPTAIWA